MYNTTVIYIMSIALIAYGGVFIIKNFLVDYKASENGFKNVAVILLMLSGVIGAMTAAADAWSIEGIMDQLQHANITNIEIRHMLERRIGDYRRESIMCIISGYVMSTVAYIIYKNIEQEIRRNLNRSKERWDWSKIRR